MPVYQTSPPIAIKRGRGRPRNPDGPTVSERIRSRTEPFFSIQPRLSDTEIGKRLNLSPQRIQQIRRLLKFPRATRAPKIKPKSIRWCLYRCLSKAGLRYCFCCRMVWTLAEYGASKTCKPCNSWLRRQERAILKAENPEKLKEFDRQRNSRQYYKHEATL
jgi:hypothetical protein